MNGLTATVRSAPDADVSVDIRIDIGADETLAVVGPNGAGKSTMVRLLAGVEPSRSSIVLAGRDISEDPPRARRIGVVFQDGVVFPHLDAADNVGFPLVAGGMSRSEARSAARDWLCHIGYEDLTGRKGSALSGGERQVVALGRAVIHQPDLVVLDEPFAALDAAARPAIRRLVASLLADNDGPALVVTHDPADAAVLADRVVVVEGGRVTQTGTVADLRAHPGSQYVADLVGVNILHGRSIDGVVTVDGEVVSTATEVSDGEVMLVIHPRAVGLYPERPRGSARNVWRSVVTAVEPMGGSVRVLFDDPWSIAAEVTTTGAEAVGAAVGLPLWISVKASEVAVTAPGV